MQGRLLPKYNGRYQAHPVGYWEAEFLLADALGLDCIEFILDFNEAAKNPLLRRNGSSQIGAVSKNSNVKVRTVCADYFMEAPLHSDNFEQVDQSLKVLEKLLLSCCKLNIESIVLPCVDQSNLKSPDERRRLISVLKPVMREFKEKRIFLSLETDLAPAAFANLIDSIDSSWIAVNYDIGNSAALGYDPKEEFDAYGEFITDVHIKDRDFAGGPVILGTGAADFKLCLSELNRIPYKGPYIMQAYRDDEGLQIFKEQFTWFQKLWRKTFAD
ncbi:MAG: xylose isomerase [Flavobacteriaceae bacterium]|nr:xylose isomerase [Flavobacteriaceae bacterium]